MINNLPSSGNTIDLVAQQLARELARFSKDNYGKGPNNVKVEINNGIVLCFFEGFMTKAEEKVAQSYPENIGKNRFIYINHSVDELNEIFLKYLQRKIKHLFPSYLPQQQLACWTVILD